MIGAVSASTRRSCIVGGAMRRATSVLGVSALLAGTMVLSDTREAHAEGPLRYEAHSTYTVDPDASMVHVLVDMTVINEKPDSTSGNIITSYYWSDISVPMMATAVNLAATRDGRSQAVRVEPSDGTRFAYAVVDLSPNLYYRDVARVQLRYDLPSAPPRSDADTRVNAAFATFLAFPVADPNLTSVRVVIPKRFDVEYLGPFMRESTVGDSLLYESGAIDDPDSWGLFVSARDDKKLSVTHADHPEHDVEIHAWPDDQPWATFVKTQITKGIPELEGLIGLPWSNPGKLTITETVSPYLYGYAGWYQSSDNSIEIGDALDGEVVLHEVSHIWFNDDLFSDRWVNEGFAQTYSNLALAEIGGKAKSPTRVKTASKGAQPLNVWGEPSLRDDEEARLEEEYGYNAAWFVVRALTNEIGPDKMREVFDAASDGRLSYLGDPDPEHIAATVTWKRVLDLVENVGGSKRATALFRDYVVSKGDQNTLQARSRARRAYDKLLAAGDGWTVSETIREDLTKWKFADATEGMQTAKRVLKVRNEITDVLDGTGIALPETFESDYETAQDLDDVLADARRYLEVAKRLADADARADAGHGVFGTIGLWGNDYPDDLAAAGDRFEDAKVDDAERAALAVIATIDDANGVGQQRTLTLLGIVVLLVAIVWMFRRWRRARRRRRLHAEASAAEARAAKLADELAMAVTHAPVPWPATTAPQASPEITSESEAGGEPFL
jgi:hypothetical protein